LSLREIPAHECLNQRWAKKNKEKAAPHILAMINQFNQVSGWVKTFVVFKQEFAPRLAAIEHFIRIAEVISYPFFPKLSSPLHNSRSHKTAPFFPFFSFFSIQIRNAWS